MNVLPGSRPLLVFSRYSLLCICMLFLGGCLGNNRDTVKTGLQVADYVAGRIALSEEGLSSQDIRDLEEGKLFVVKSRLEKLQKEELSFTQLSLLFDINLKLNDFGEAAQYLSLQEKRLGEGHHRLDEEEIDSFLGRKTLLQIKLGLYDEALATSRAMRTEMGAFFKSLTGTYLGQKKDARILAKKLSYYWDNKQKLYMSALLYMALEEYNEVLKVLHNPRGRLLKDFGLLSYTNALGQTIPSATFRLDFLGEFNFGLSQAFSFAPKANTYVEFMAAKAFYETGDLPEAKKRFLCLVTNPEALLFRDVLWISHQYLGKIQEQQGKVDKAIERYVTAVTLVEEIRSSINTDSLKAGFSSNKFDLYNSLIELLIQKGDSQKCLEIVERSKARLLVDMLATRASFGKSKMAGDASVAYFEDYTKAEQKLLAGAGNLTRGNLVRGVIEDLSLAKNNLIEYAPDLASLVTVSPSSFQELQDLVADDELVIIFHKKDTQIYSFALTSTAIKFNAVSLPHIDEMVDEFRLKVQEYDNTSYTALSKRLYTELLGSFDEMMARKKRLTVVPSGSLFYLPFAALIDGEEKFLVEKASIRILPSFTLAGLLKKTGEELASSKKQVLVFANPWLGDSLYDLPGAEIEAKIIADIFDEATVYAGKDASLIRFKDQAGKFSFIHMACHGQFKSNAPLESRLLLASDQQDLDSGSLTVNQLYDMDIPANLFVLSACETAVTHLSPGDDVIGLQRGVLYAGSKRLVGSLWQIADEPTSFLMEHFYTSLKRGDIYMDALQLAQIATMEKFNHPYFWAPFIFTGMK